MLFFVLSSACCIYRHCIGIAIAIDSNACLSCRCEATTNVSQQYMHAYSAMLFSICIQITRSWTILKLELSRVQCKFIWYGHLFAMEICVDLRLACGRCTWIAGGTAIVVESHFECRTHEPWPMDIWMIIIYFLCHKFRLLWYFGENYIEQFWFLAKFDVGLFSIKFVSVVSFS